MCVGGGAAGAFSHQSNVFLASGRNLEETHIGSVRMRIQTQARLL